jgi:hypothetical protein
MVRLRQNCALLASQILPAPNIPGSTSKSKGTPRKYQDGPSSCAGTRSGEDGDSLESCLAGVGITTAWYTAGIMDLFTCTGSAAVQVWRSGGWTPAAIRNGEILQQS